LGFGQVINQSHFQMVASPKSRPARLLALLALLAN